MKTAFTRGWRNTSQFPDAWARPVAEWIASRLEIIDGKQIWIRNTSRGGHGHAGGRYASCAVSRRGWRKNWRYTGMRHSPDYKVDNALEAFVMLIAHELYHVSPQGRQLIAAWESRGGHWRQSMEYRTNAKAWSIVLEYRAERRRFLKLYAAYIGKIRTRQLQQRRAAEIKSTPDFRVEHARKMAAMWDRKARIAARRAKKWASRANRIAGAIRRKSAEFSQVTQAATPT